MEQIEPSASWNAIKYTNTTVISLRTADPVVIDDIKGEKEINKIAQDIVKNNIAQHGPNTIDQRVDTDNSLFNFNPINNS